LDKRLGGPQSHSGCHDDEKNSQTCCELNPRTPIVQPVAQRYTELSQLFSENISYRKPLKKAIIMDTAIKFV